MGLLRARASCVSIAAYAAASGTPAAADRCAAAAGPLPFTLLARAQHSVALVDPAPEKPWPNNYGVWTAEWAALAEEIPELADCVRLLPAAAHTFLGGKAGSRVLG